MSRLSLPCIVCQKPLVNVDEDGSDNQPHGGTEFTTRGHYGSTIIDEIGEDPLEFAVNICDTCIMRAIDKGIIQSRSHIHMLSDEAIHAGYQAMLKDRRMRVGDRESHAVAFRHAAYQVASGEEEIVLSRHVLTDEQRAWVLTQNEKQYGSAWGEDQSVDYYAEMRKAGWKIEDDEEINLKEEV